MIKNFTIYFLKSEFYHFTQTFVKVIKTAIFLPICKFKVWRAKKHNCVDFIELFNFEKRNVGWSTDHDYEITCKFKQDADEKDIKRFDSIIINGIKFKKVEE